MITMIGLSSLEYSNTYELVLKPTSDLLKLKDRSRRSSRVPTLDGGAVLIDSGASASDRNFSITLPQDLTEAEYNILRSMVDNLSQMLVTNDEGAFIAHPKSIIQDRLLIQLLSEAS